MFRFVAIALMVSCLTAPASAQTQSAQSSAPAAPTNQPSKKPASKAKTGAMTGAMTGAIPAAATETGSCQIGVIPAVGDRFSVQHIGLTVFGNESTEVPIESWRLDDLVVARVRAIAGARTSVKRIAHSREAFEPYYHPPTQFFRNASNDLTAVVRQIATKAHCERYLVVTRSAGQVAGTNQSADGIGVLTNWSSGAFKKGSLFAFIKITVFDGQSFAEHDDPLGNVGARLAADLSNLLKEQNFQQIDDFEAPTTPEAAASNSRLRDGTRAMLAAKLDKILPAYLSDDGKVQ